MTDRGMPKCPWCGREMHIGYDGKGMAFGRCYFYCDCGAQAPCACVEYATPDDWIGIEGAAYLKATARPMQKPLTVEKLFPLPDVVYVECSYFDEVYAALPERYDKQTIDLMMRDECCRFLLKGYGKTWRCWAGKPTEEEREAAGWYD